MSESVTISLSRPRKPKSIGSLLKETGQHRRALAKLSVPTSGAIRQSPPRVWPENLWLYELGRKVRDRLGDKRFLTGRFMAELEAECRKYVDKNGQPLKAKSIWQNLRRVDCWKCGRTLETCVCMKPRNISAKKTL
jgi:hypothetical protein